MKDWVCYEKIQEMNRNHLNKSQVARNLQIDRGTVRKYWEMSADLKCIGFCLERKSGKSLRNTIEIPESVC